MILPPPPENLNEWLSMLVFITTLLGLFIAAMRKWIVGPILAATHLHAAEHALLMAQLAPNGHEDQLPAGERDKPMRQLVIYNRRGVLKLERDTELHMADSARWLDAINADRLDRGLEPLDYGANGG